MQLQKLGLWFYSRQTHESGYTPGEGLCIALYHQDQVCGNISGTDFFNCVILLQSLSFVLNLYMKTNRR